MTHFTACAITLLFLAHLACETIAQTAVSPAPAGPKNVTAILEKAGQFGTLIRLLRSTQVGDQINNQLNNSNSGLTIFAPTDNAFSSLPSGTLNSLNDQQKVSLLQFHILPTAIQSAQFQTVSNPLRTQAGDASNGRFPLNVTTTGNQVNISTGVDTTQIANTLFADGQLAVYQVDKVLLPLELFGAPAPYVAPTPAPAKPVKDKPVSIADGPSSPSTDSTDTSAAVTLNWSKYGSSMAFAAAAILLWWSF